MREEPDPFVAGNLANHLEEWSNITSDPVILNMIKGERIEFETHAPQCHGRDSVLGVSQEDINSIDIEIQKLLTQQVIVESCHEDKEYVSQIFPRKKSNGQTRLILNLKGLNAHCPYKKFKMASFKSALELISKNAWVASLDLTSAYYSVPMAKPHQKYLKFIWKQKLYAFTCVPFGLSQMPRRFTKLTKPILAHLHRLGHTITCYLDDFLIVANSYDACLRAVTDTVNLLNRLGFSIQPEKCVLIPTHEIKYLGFTINTSAMSIALPTEKRIKIKNMCKHFMKENKYTIRTVASLIGTLVSSFPAVEYGPLHYRYIENDKKMSLCGAKGKWESVMSLSDNAINELKWWVATIDHVVSPMSHGDPIMVITTDASGQGYGIECNGQQTGGTWTVDEQNMYHINEREMLAAFYGLKVHARNIRSAHIRCRLDNIPALTCLNKMGSHKINKLNAITQLVWEWCLERQLHISCVFVPGAENTIADFESRNIKNIDSEYKLNSSLLFDALNILEIYPDIDLFASRANKQFTPYISYRPDPECINVDSFSVNWNNNIIYAFPPFCIITRVLKKIIADNARGIVVVPHWPAQNFYPMLMGLLTQPPVLLSARTNLLHLPSRENQLHPLHKSLRLMVCAVSGKPSQNEVSLMMQPHYSWHHGDPKPKEHINQSLTNGKGMLLNKRWIPFHLL